MLIGVLCGTPMPRRLFVRLNGRADGGVVVSIGDNTTEEEFLQKATARLFRGQPNHVDPSGAKIYFEGGQYEDLRTHTCRLLRRSRLLRSSHIQG